MKEYLSTALYVIGVFAFIGLFVWYLTAAPCEVYAISPQADVPARCFDNFSGGR